MNVLPANPLAFWTAQMEANQNSGAANGTFTTLTFATDLLNLPGGLIDRPTTTRMRALLAGYYRIQYRLSHFNTGNSTARGAESRLFLNNATAVADSVCSSGALNSATQAGVLIASPIVLLATNDFLEVQVAPRSATAHTVIAAYGFFRMELLRLT